MISNEYERTVLFKSALGHNIEVSDRNHIGVQNDKGMEIVTLNCSASSPSLFTRFIIETPKNFPLAKHLSSERNEFLWSLDIKSITELATDPYAARIICSAGNPTVERFKFSPADGTTTYLAILTTFMALTVYKDDAGKWTQVCDITEEWLKFCTPKWTKPTTAIEWYQHLNQVKLNTFCWQKFNQELFLITAFENGNIAVFSKNFKLIHQFPTMNYPPIDLHSLQLDENIFLTISYRTGQILGIVFHPVDFKVLKKIDVWEKEDLLEPCPIHALKSGSGIDVVFAKTDEIFVVVLETNWWSKTVDSKVFDHSISSLAIGGEFIYAMLSSSDVFRISASSLNEMTQIHAGQSYCPAGACTTNGHVFVMASVISDVESFVTLLLKANFDAKFNIGQFLRGGGKIIDAVDLLWLHKRYIIENNLGENCFEDTKIPELQYWELKLSLTLLPPSNEKSREMIVKKLEDLGTSLLSQKINSCILTNDQCPICEQDMNKDSLHIATCKNNHSVPRCCISLRPCSALEEACCALCQSKISLKYVDNYQNASCTLCSGYFKKRL